MKRKTLKDKKAAEIRIEIPVSDVLRWRTGPESVAGLLIDEAEDRVEAFRPGFHEEDVRSTEIGVGADGRSFIVTFTLFTEEEKP